VLSPGEFIHPLFPVACTGCVFVAGFVVVAGAVLVAAGTVEVVIHELFVGFHV